MQAAKEEDEQRLLPGPQQHEEVVPSWFVLVWRSAWPALLFGLTTLTLNLVNKAVFSLFDFDRMLFLGFCGNLVTVLLLRVGKTLRDRLLNLVTAGNWVFMNKVKGEIDISKLEMVYFNALGALPILMGPLYLSGELDSLA
eukprot:g2414.t1